MWEKRFTMSTESQQEERERYHAWKLVISQVCIVFIYLLYLSIFCCRKQLLLPRLLPLSLSKLCFPRFSVARVCEWRFPSFRTDRELSARRCLSFVQWPGRGSCLPALVSLCFYFGGEGGGSAGTRGRAAERGGQQRRRRRRASSASHSHICFLLCTVPSAPLEPAAERGERRQGVSLCPSGRVSLHVRTLTVTTMAAANTRWSPPVSAPGAAAAVPPPRRCSVAPRAPPGVPQLRASSSAETVHGGE